MLIIDIPGKGCLTLAHLVLDVNGTIAFDGVLIDGVEEAVAALGGTLKVALVTADAHGGAAAMAASLGVGVTVIEPGNESAQKAAFVESLGASSTVAVGNGANDDAMLKASAIGICVIGPEGAAGPAVVSADVVTRSIGDALGLLRVPSRLTATLRV
ncbi:MAG: HAD family hydrolase [Clostridiales bacterium]|nr:HAD family hydrolase [Clostridiales bacterium]